MIERLAAHLSALIYALVGEIRDPEERRKRYFLIMALLILIPGLLAFGTSNLTHGDFAAASAPLGIAALLCGAIAWCRHLPSAVPVMRLIFVCTLVVVLGEVVTGGGEGFAFLWAYLLPVWSFVVFGTGEGRRWVGLLYGTVTAALLISPAGYEAALVTRFLLTLALVSMFAYAIESSRATAAQSLHREKRALEDALKHIRTLSGLIPICASCHKIRDDRGSWNELEHYLASRADVQFTHGLCPWCLEHSKHEIKDYLSRNPRPPARPPAPPPPGA